MAAALIDDFRLAARRLSRQPGFALAAVAALALGIGSSASIFTVVEAVMLKPLPYPEPERLLLVWETQPGLGQASLSAPDLRDWQAQVKSLEFSAYAGATENMTGRDRPERLAGVLTDDKFFSVLRARAAIGRTYAPGAKREVVLSDGIFRRLFAADPSIVGKQVVLNGESRQVVGVLPPGFSFPAWGEVWVASDDAAPVPVGAPRSILDQRGSHYMKAIARLAPGATLEGARAQLLALGEQLEKAYPDNNTGHRAGLGELQRELAGPVAGRLFALLGGVALLLLIACANVAGLQLAQVAARQREVATRLALGATRFRLVRQLLTESTLLSLAGGALGLVVARLGVSAMLALAPADLPRAAAIHLDWPVLAFTFTLALCTGLLFGLLPALQLREQQLYASLGSGGAGLQAGQGRLARTLVAAEMVLALTVLIGAGLLLRSFWRLTHAPTGLQTSSVLTLYLPLPEVRYGEGLRAPNFYDELVRRVEALPGVARASAISSLPMTDRTSDTFFHVEGLPFDTSLMMDADIKCTTPGWFEITAMRTTKGRALLATDTADSPLVATVNETLVKRAFPGEDPLGRRIELLTSANQRKIYAQIVGVVSDAHNRGVSHAVNPEIYLPHQQARRLWEQPIRWMSLVIKSKGVAPESLSGSVVRTIRELDRELVPIEVRTFDEVVARQVSQPRFILALLSVFALVALLLGAVGVYGVLSTWVMQRTRELGVRLALGAERRQVLQLVLLQGLKPVLIGLVAGLALSAALSRYLGSLLFEVKPLDVPTFAAVTAVLLAAAALAALLPARRATRVDPMTALRSE